MDRVQAERVGGHCCALRDRVQAGKETKPGVEAVLADMRVALVTEQLQGEEGK